ncbi:MAG: hypothetical protein V7704_22705 [Aurantimonas endophytica]|uniref:hypothetical protein n=1 Tax=Aurantimonas endophytica TaxID=1522175 RepID=UPI003002A581
MPAKTYFIVQQYEKRGRRLVAGRQLPFNTAAEASARADRDADRFAGVVAVQQTVDIETGEVLDEPVVLARHGELPREFAED